MQRLFIPLALALLAAGCGSNPADGVIRVETMVTDGEAVYAVLQKPNVSTLVVKYDADGKTVWEQEIGPSEDGGYFHDGYLWVVEFDPPGRDLPYDAPDFLLKIDPETGEVLGTVMIAPDTDNPKLVIDGQLWLLSTPDMTFEVVDLDTLTIEETHDVRVGEALEHTEGFRGRANHAVRIGDHIYFVARDPTSIVKFSISRREIEDILVDRNLRLRGPIEVHDGQLWLPDVQSRSTDESGWLAHRVDLDNFTIAATMPFLESPMWSLTTDRYIFDQAVVSNEDRFAGIDRINQIDRKTGNVIRTIEGNRPQFVLDGHLWLANLERVKID